MLTMGFVYYQSPTADPLTVELFQFQLPSHHWLHLNVSDIIIVLGLGLLFQEINKSTDSDDVTIRENVLSFVVFLAYLLSFFFVPFAANSTFLILCMMSLVDTVSGFIITAKTARKDYTITTPGSFM